MKVVAEMVAEAWDEVKQDTLQKSWQKIIPLPSSNPISRGIWHGVRIRIRHDSEETINAEQNAKEDNEELEVSTVQDIFKEVGFDMDADAIIEWLGSDSMDPGVQVFEICELVSKSESENEVQSDDDSEDNVDQTPRISNSDAVRMLEQCLVWLEQQPEATVYNTTVLWELHSLVVSKRMDSLKQAKITQYFSNKS